MKTNLLGGFARGFFAKLVPNVRKLGLLDANNGYLRERWGEAGLLEFEFADDTGSDYETYDAVAAGPGRTAPPAAETGPRPPDGSPGSASVARIRAICLALPEAVEKPFGDHSSPAFRVRDKFFAMVDEEGATMNVKAPKGVQGILVASDSERFFVPRYVGHIGWVGVRLDRPADPDWDELAEMITESYCLIAPKRLAAQVEAPPTS